MFLLAFRKFLLDVLFIIPQHFFQLLAASWVMTRVGQNSLRKVNTKGWNFRHRNSCTIMLRTDVKGRRYRGRLWSCECTSPTRQIPKTEFWIRALDIFFPNSDSNYFIFKCYELFHCCPPSGNVTSETDQMKASWLILSYKLILASWRLKEYN